MRHVLAAPHKRLWTADWFAPVLRVGRVGSDDLVMPPVGKVRATYPAYVGPPVPNLSPVDPKYVDDLRSTSVAGAANVAVLKFVAPRSGELYVYVNDAVLMVPGSTDLFYGNNSGTATLKVIEIEDSDKK